MVINRGSIPRSPLMKTLLSILLLLVCTPAHAQDPDIAVRIRQERGALRNPTKAQVILTTARVRANEAGLNIHYSPGKLQNVEPSDIMSNGRVRAFDAEAITSVMIERAQGSTDMRDLYRAILSCAPRVTAPAHWLRMQRRRHGDAQFWARALKLQVGNIVWSRHLRASSRRPRGWDPRIPWANVRGNWRAIYVQQEEALNSFLETGRRHPCQGNGKTLYPRAWTGNIQADLDYIAGRNRERRQRRQPLLIRVDCGPTRNTFWAEDK